MGEYQTAESLLLSALVDHMRDELLRVRATLKLVRQGNDAQVVKEYEGYCVEIESKIETYSVLLKNSESVGSKIGYVVEVSKRDRSGEELVSRVQSGKLKYSLN